MKDELVDVKALYAPCPSQIKALKEHIARLDKELSLEIEVKEELDKRLAAEQRKEAELDAMLAIEKRKEADLEKHLNATKEKLAKEEKQLAEDKETFNRVYESKDAEIADLEASSGDQGAQAVRQHDSWSPQDNHRAPTEPRHAQGRRRQQGRPPRRGPEDAARPRH